MKTNIKGVLITRPTQELVIMRGIPGSGKSTMAKSLVREGRIHSTDDVIELQGDYDKFFATMKESKDFSPLARAHSTNYKNIVKSISEGVSPVIVDNTNIKANEAKQIVVKALEMGLDENNISIVDMGTNGLTAEVLADRNTHGVPLDKIKSMIESYKSVGNLTIKKILDSKDMYPQSDVLYSCVLLEKASQNVLFYNLEKMIPEGWVRIGHHMTICMGPLKDKTILGTDQYLVVNKVGISDMAMAVAVESDIETKNKIPHVTVAINPDGGKPVMSNDITNWQDVRMFILLGKVTEIKKGS